MSVPAMSVPAMSVPAMSVPACSAPPTWPDIGPSIVPAKGGSVPPSISVPALIPARAMTSDESLLGASSAQAKTKLLISNHNIAFETDKIVKP